MSNMFGESKIGGYTQRKRYKLKDGDNIYRILPAMGDLAEDGVWSVYYNVVFGFKTLEGKHRPFQSPQVSKSTGKGKDRVTTIEVHCAATDFINKLKDEMEAAKKAGNHQKAAQLAKIVGDYPTMGVYSLNNDHYLNVVDRQGNIGQLELGHKAKTALNAEITRLRKDEGYDPLSPTTGRFLNIRRDGAGRDTAVKVTVVKEKLNLEGVGPVEKDIVHVIDDAFAARLLTKNKNGKWIYKEAADLTKLFKYPTAAEVELIVKTADILTGKSAGIDEVFKSNDNQSAEQGAGGQEPESEQETENTQTAAVGNATQVSSTLATQPTAQAAPVAPTTLATAPAAAPVQTQVAKEAKAAAAAAPAATKTTAEAIAAMSPDDFMKTMGITL